MMTRFLQLFLTVWMVFAFGCSTGKKATKGYTNEEIEVDAYAKANLDCNYRILLYKSLDDIQNKQLDGALYEMVKKKREFEQKIKYKYLKDSTYSRKYRNYYQKASTFFHSCKKADLMKKEREAKTEENKTP